MKIKIQGAASVLTATCLSLWFALPLFARENQPSSSVASQYDFAPVRAYIQKTLAEKQLPSVSVAVAKNGKTIWEESFGWADREKMIPATPETIYALASLTKPYTSTGVLELVEEHKIDLDAPINQYLGSAPITAIVGDASGATVRRVLCHTSGLPIHSANLFGNGEQIPPMADVIRRYGVLVNPPGRYFNYSNLGYGVLAYMTSLVARLDWKDYMRDKVFLPLGLLHTSVGIGPGLEPYAAARYDNQNRRLSPFAADAPGASAIWASAHDVVRFGMFQLKDHLPDQQRILSDTTFDLMKKSATGGVPSAGTMLGQKSYGLGWFIEPDDHGYTVGPSGWRQFAPFTYDHHSKFGAVPGPGPRLRGSIRRARQFRQPSKQSGVAASHASRLQKTSCPARIMPPSPYPQRRGRP